MNTNFNDPEVQRLAKMERERVLAEYKEENTVKSKYIKIVPQSYQWAMYKIFNGEKSRTKAIKMKCMDCCCWQKEEVKNCEVFTCALYDFRPYGK